MPIYSYHCNDCDSYFELFFSIKNYQDYPKCNCGSINTQRNYIEDFHSIIGTVKKSDNELKTVGDLANRNRDRLSDDQKLELQQKHNQYKESVSEKDLPKGMSRIQKPKTKTKWNNL
jgi:putative FmdB family regulatory protein